MFGRYLFECYKNLYIIFFVSMIPNVYIYIQDIQIFLLIECIIKSRKYKHGNNFKIITMFIYIYKYVLLMIVLKYK